MNNNQPTEIEIAAIVTAINTYLTEESDSSISNNYLTPWKAVIFNISNHRDLLGWTEKLNK